MKNVIVISGKVDLDRDEDGWWGYCRPGWQNSGEPSHTFHEDTRTDLISSIRADLKKCDCDECKKDMARKSLLAR